MCTCEGQTSRYCLRWYTWVINVFAWFSSLGITEVICCKTVRSSWMSVAYYDIQSWSAPGDKKKKGRNPEIKWRHTTSLCYGGLHVNWFALVEFSRALTEVFSRYEVNIVHFIFILICNFTKLTFDGKNFDAFSCGSSPASSEAGKQGSGLNCLIKLDAVMFFFLFWNTWNGVEI